jgi:hypothetical protein
MPSDRAAQIALCLMLVCLAMACLLVGTAKASYYRMVLCGANNGSNSFQTATNTNSSQNPNGIFSFDNYCGPAPFPAGNNAFLRIAENQSGGNAGVNAYGSISWTVTPFIAIAAAGGYTREPNSFNEGWRGRFWLEGFDGSTNNVLVQGLGVDNGSCGGVCWSTTSTFASHLWPFGGYGNYRRFVFELTCYRPAGCDRTNFNAVDANSFVLVLNDVVPPGIDLHEDSGALLSGQWVRGSQPVSWATADEGSGIRYEWLRVDGAERAVVDRTSQCDIDSNSATGEFAREFVPCPRGGWFDHSTSLDTASLSDGSHSLQACVQDYAESVGLNGTSGQVCDGRAIHTDNNPPAAPGGLTIVTSNPERYLAHFGARWTLPPDPGSPIVRVHYRIVDPSGSVVVPEQVATGTNPTELGDIAGPKAAGEYRLQVWLEDAVGFSGPVATVPIPHDTTPPAAPQDVSVTTPTTRRSEQGFDVSWRNITDNGSPIDSAHYQVLNGAGEVVVATKDLGGDNPQSLTDLDAPKNSGNYTLKVWLSDAEGNVGAPAEAPLSYDCVRSDVSGGQNLSAGIGDKLGSTVTVHQGQGSSVGGSLSNGNGPVSGASVCVFSRVITDGDADFIGIAMTGKGGTYSFPVTAGPSRELITRYRDGHREIEAHATVLTQIEPTLSLRKKVVHNKHKAIFYGDIPGPHNDNVVIVLQVRSGKGWRAFRRYRTRDGGHYEVGYRFTRTSSESVYTMRAQVRRTVGLPYEPGNSRELKLRVKP